MNSVETILSSAVRLSVPLTFAACGEYIAERAGTLNISVEAMMLSGAYAGALGSSVMHNAGAGLVWGVVVGVAVGMIHGNLSHRFTANPFVVGITLNVLALGLTSYLLATVTIAPRQVGILTIPVLSHIPIVKSIYNSVQQVSDTLFSSSGNAFREAVLVQYPRAGCWTIAFVTGRPGGEAALHLRGDYLSVYVPTTPNPTSGFFLMLPRADVIALAMSVDEALKYVISMGVVAPPTRLDAGSVALRNLPG